SEGLYAYRENAIFSNMGSSHDRLVASGAKVIPQRRQPLPQVSNYDLRCCAKIPEPSRSESKAASQPEARQLTSIQKVYRYPAIAESGTVCQSTSGEHFFPVCSVHPVFLRVFMMLNVII